MKKAFICIIVFFLVSLPVYSQYSACQFLREDVGARSIALTGAYITYSDRSDVVFSNPASVSGRYAFSSIHTLPQYNDESIMTTALSYSHPVESLNGIVSLMLYYENYGDAIQTNEFNEDVSTFSLYDLMVGVAYTTPLTDIFSAGVSVKYVYSHYFHTNIGSAFAFDLGFLGTTHPSLFKSDELKVAIVLQNISSGITYQDQEQSDSLPTMFRAGFSYATPLVSRLTSQFSTELRRELQTSVANYEYVSGLELGYDATFFARMGLVYEEYSKETTINWGIGLRRFGVTIDYARKEIADMALYANVFSIGYLF